MSYGLRSIMLVVAIWFVIGVPAADAQWISAIPRASRTTFPTDFVSACNNLDQWPTVKSVTGYLGSFAHDLPFIDDPTLQQCLANLNANGLFLTIEAAAYQPDSQQGPGCGDASGCFNAIWPLIERLQGLGAGIILIRLQEPLTNARNVGHAPEHAVNQTVLYMQAIRASYANIEFTSVEAYPYNDAALLNWWMQALRNTSNDVGIPPPNGFEVDDDWNVPGSISDINSMLNTAHSLGWTFNYIFGSPVPTTTNWHNHAHAAGIWLQENGVVPDIYTFESWEEEADPPFTIPETTAPSFMYTVKTFREAGYFPR